MKAAGRLLSDMFTAATACQYLLHRPPGIYLPPLIPLIPGGSCPQVRALVQYVLREVGVDTLVVVAAWAAALYNQITTIVAYASSLRRAAATALYQAIDKRLRPVEDQIADLATSLSAEVKSARDDVQSVREDMQSVRQDVQVRPWQAPLAALLFLGAGSCCRPSCRCGALTSARD